MPSLAEATLSPAWQLAVTRSFVYALLCRVLAYPTLAHQAALREHLIPALQEFDGEGKTAEVRRALPDTLDEMRAQHTSIFSLTVSADCPDYESAYNSRDVFQQTQQMADVGGFYRANGLQVGGEESERPDHITTELQFMSFLALKEAYAIETRGKDELATVIEAQTLFLRDHLACWGPGLGSRIEARAGGVSPLFAAAGALLTSWLGAECTRLGVEPALHIAEPQLAWPEPDDGACGATGDCPLISLDEIEVAR
jgi:TorA maturation chaperone TorD